LAAAGFRIDRRNENICSMQDRPSDDPRDDAIRAALRDGAALAAMLSDEFQSTYRGSERSEYVRVLASTIEDLGGRLAQQGVLLAAEFADRRITIHLRATGRRSEADQKAGPDGR
jgi:hypothetical protein